MSFFERPLTEFSKIEFFFTKTSVWAYNQSFKKLPTWFRKKRLLLSSSIISKIQPHRTSQYMSKSPIDVDNPCFPWSLPVLVRRLKPLIKNSKKLPLQNFITDYFFIKNFRLEILDLENWAHKHRYKIDFSSFLSLFRRLWA